MCPAARVNRTLFSRFAAEALGERGSWILDPEGDVSLVVTRRLRGGRGAMGLAMMSGPSSGEVLEAAVAVPAEGGWRLVPSYWSLLGLLNKEDVDEAISDPSRHWEELAEEISGMAPEPIWGGIFPTLEEAERAILDSLSFRSSTGRRSGGPGSGILQKISSLLDAGTLEDRAFSFSIRFGILLGSWTAGDFDRRFEIGLEIMRLLELEALRSGDLRGSVPKVDEFVLTGEVSARGERGRASVDLDVVAGLYWIHLDMVAPDLGGKLVRRRWQAGRVSLSKFPEWSTLPALLLDGTLWGKISSKALGAIISSLRDRFSDLTANEAALGSGNPGLGRLVGSIGAQGGGEPGEGGRSGVSRS